MSYDDSIHFPHEISPRGLTAAAGEALAARLGAEVAPAPFSGQFHAAQARRLTALPESPAAALPVAPVERAPEPAPPPLPAGRELGRGRAWTSKRGW